MSASREPDLVVLGGGPAGASLAGLVKKYSPGAHVVLFERERFPRHHIGESFVADVNRLLFDLGAYDRVARAGFVPKHGSTFVWGRDREPWSVEFQDLEAIPGYGAGRGYQTGHTWHVRRDAYDALLLEHARDLGVQVHAGTAATFTVDAEGRAGPVTAADGRTLRPRLVVDATGQHNLVARQMSTLAYDPELQNVAVYGYHRGARLDPALSGTWEASRIAVVSIDEGWVWLIPLGPDLLSVGVVTSREVFARRGAKDPAALLDEALAGCAELRHTLAGTTRVRYPGAPADVLVMRDYCYSVARLHGPGWALCGDAAGFVDPILSIGCYLAHTAASHLAHGVGSILAGDAVDEALCLRAYEEQVQYGLRAFRRMTYMFYGGNASKETWWWEAKRVLAERALPTSVKDRSAFLALATGYGINRPVYQEAIADFGVNLFEDFYRHLVAPQSLREVGAAPPADAVYRLRHATKVEPWVVPVEGTGRMRALLRVTFPGEGGEGGRGGEARSRLLLPAAFARLLEGLDGATADQAAARLTPDERGQVEGPRAAFLRGLVDMGVLEATP